MPHSERDGIATLSTTLSATLPAAEAVGMFAVLDQHARACGSGDSRTMDAPRADTLTDLVLGETGFCSTDTNPTATGSTTTGTGTGTGNDPTATDAGHDDEAGTPPIAPTPSRFPRIAPDRGTRTATTNVSIQIRVTVGLDSLRGDSNEPAELTEYRPITAAQARELAADPSSTWRHPITDPPPAGSSTSAPPATDPHPT